VKTNSGTLEGSTENGVSSFKGLPFAAPPVGDLRWRAPQPPAAWEGVRKANEFGASCMQVKAGERLPWTREFMVQNQISEDCLYLNIWTPQVKAGANLPVMVVVSVRAPVRSKSIGGAIWRQKVRLSLRSTTVSGSSGSLPIPS